jgi:hypothetical protein
MNAFPTIGPVGRLLFVLAAAGAPAASRRRRWRTTRD